MKPKELPAKEAKAYSAMVTLSNYCKKHECDPGDCLFCYGEEGYCDLEDYPINWRRIISERIENMNAGGHDEH
jgi:histone acetyltransferase (RNA polymerase elongator complex component)